MKSRVWDWIVDNFAAVMILNVAVCTFCGLWVVAAALYNRGVAIIPFIGCGVTILFFSFTQWARRWVFFPHLFEVPGWYQMRKWCDTQGVYEIRGWDSAGNLMTIFAATKEQAFQVANINGAVRIIDEHGWVFTLQNGQWSSLPNRGGAA